MNKAVRAAPTPHPTDTDAASSDGRVLLRFLSLSVAGVDTPGPGDITAGTAAAGY